MLTKCPIWLISYHARIAIEENLEISEFIVLLTNEIPRIFACLKGQLLKIRCAVIAQPNCVLCVGVCPFHCLAFMAKLWAETFKNFFSQSFMDKLAFYTFSKTALDF